MSNQQKVSTYVGLFSTYAQAWHDGQPRFHPPFAIPSYVGTTPTPTMANKKAKGGGKKKGKGGGGGGKKKQVTSADKGNGSSASPIDNSKCAICEEVRSSWKSDFAFSTMSCCGHSVCKACMDKASAKKLEEITTKAAEMKAPSSTTDNSDDDDNSPSPPQKAQPAKQTCIVCDMPVTNDSKERIKRLLTLAMDKKHPIAQYLLAKEGLDGNLRGDPTKWLVKAAEGGYPPAMTGLADLYRTGDFGVEQSYVKAKAWYEKALLRGDYAPALYEIACMYRDVVDDEETCYSYMRKAADDDYPLAMQDLAVYLCSRGDDDLLDESLKIFRRASEMQVGAPAIFKDPKYKEAIVGCQYMAASLIMLCAGDDADPVPAEALRWAKAASMNGHKQAKVTLDDMKSSIALSDMMSKKKMTVPSVKTK